MRTPQEIKQMVEDLKNIKPRVRKMTAFGDNNHEAIEWQIRVLEAKMDEDEIFDALDDSASDDTFLRDNALDAWGWMKGEEVEGGLLEGWQELT